MQPASPAARVEGAISAIYELLLPPPTPDKGTLSFLSLGIDLPLNELMVNNEVSAKKSIDLKVS